MIRILKASKDRIKEKKEGKKGLINKIFKQA